MNANDPIPYEPAYGTEDCGPGCTPEAHAFCSEVLQLFHPWPERYQGPSGYPDPQPGEGGCELCFKLAPLVAARALLQRTLLALDERNASALRAEIQAVLRGPDA